MIYFLVNNNFHLIDAEQHLKDLKEYKTGLIKIPHKLTIPVEHSFDVQMEFPKLISRLKDHFNLRKIFLTHREIRNQLKNISSTDTLIFYTEYEYLTHYIVKLFKRKNARVILLEEGFPTYLTFSTLPDNRLPLKKKILGYYLNYILGYRTTKIVSINNNADTQLKDSQIDQLLLYTDLNVRRNVKTNLLPSAKKEFANLDENTVLYLNEGIYLLYVTMEEYLRIIDDILQHLSLNFEKVYFKFHPREAADEKNQARTIIQKYQNVKIVEDNSPVELMIPEIGAKYVTSFLAQTQLYLSNSNCVSIYLFHLYPELMRNQAYQSVKNVIDQMNYVFMPDWSQIKNPAIGFTKINDSKTNPLKFYLENH